ncbi:MAG: thioredoxin fold domain-containing protein [Chlorobi bacterium]|nr:thioredoxin fold domain-containing protein [Chlorobiota bacterium]
MKNKLFLLFIVVLVMSLNLQAQILDPVKWRFHVEQTGREEAVLVFTADIDPTWHLYAQDIPPGGPIPTSFSFNKSPDYELVGKVTEKTEGEVILDPSFNMKLKLFSDQAIFHQKIKILTEKAFSITGTLEFMSCDDERCLPPKEVDFKFDLGKSGKEVTAKTETAAPVTFENKVDLLTGKSLTVGQEETAATLQTKSDKRSLWGFFFLAILAGLAGTLTPCVFPMIPMTIAFFSRETGSRSKSLLQAFIFGISIMMIYTLVGLIVSLTSAGADFANTLSTHWIPNLIFFLLFLVFAAAFFGMFELVLPNSLITRADRQVDKGGMLAAFFMGLTTVLVSFSCTGPLVGALLVEAASGDVIKPTVGMFGFGLAFATPFTLFAIFPAWLKKLPKSGGWLNSVEVVLGFIVLAFSMKFLSTIDQTYHFNLISRDVYLAVWIVLFLLMGFYLLGKIKFKKDSDLSYISFPRLVFVIISFTFAVYLIPGLFGAPLKPVSGLIPPPKAQKFDLTRYAGTAPAVAVTAGNISALCDPPKYADLFHLPYGLTGYYDYEQGLACARKLNKPVFLDFKGHACSNCKEMEAKVWSDPEVLKRLKENFVIIALYVDDRTKLPESEWVTSSYDGRVKKTIGKKNADLQIAKFGVNSQPYYVIMDTEEHVLVEPMAFNLNISEYVDFLDHGFEAFRKTHPAK